jgi:hypothetical protein
MQVMKTKYNNLALCTSKPSLDQNQVKYLKTNFNSTTIENLSKSHQFKNSLIFLKIGSAYLKLKLVYLKLKLAYLLLLNEQLSPKSKDLNANQALIISENEIANSDNYCLSLNIKHQKSEI